MGQSFPLTFIFFKLVKTTNQLRTNLWLLHVFFVATVPQRSMFSDMDPVSVGWVGLDFSPSSMSPFSHWAHWAHNCGDMNPMPGERVLESLGAGHVDGSAVTSLLAIKGPFVVDALTHHVEYRGSFGHNLGSTVLDIEPLNVSAATLPFLFRHNLIAVVCHLCHTSSFNMFQTVMALSSYIRGLSSYGPTEGVWF